MFGRRGSPHHFTTFIGGFVLWIAIYIKHIDTIYGYIDNVFSFKVEDHKSWYEPYHCLFPDKQR
jgi:hypothetical protein